MILCCGEALIDMIPGRDADGRLTYSPHVGGAVFNTAIALGRLEVDVGLVSGVSTDPFSDRLVAALEADGVDVSGLIRSERLTTLAIVHLDGSSASYSFYDEGSAGRMITASQAPNISENVEALFFGGISLAAEPSADAFATMLQHWRVGRTVMLDPNIRPDFNDDVVRYRDRLDRMIGLTDYLKVSDEDLKWMTEGEDLESAARRFLGRGPSVVIVTRGAEGAFAVTSDGTISIPSEPVQVTDTVGAGDTFNAGFLCELGRLNALVRRPGDEQLSAALHFGAKCAAYTCGRVGADPPRIRSLG